MQLFKYKGWVETSHSLKIKAILKSAGTVLIYTVSLSKDMFAGLGIVFFGALRWHHTDITNVS